jgi:hypothetical protein
MKGILLLLWITTASSTSQAKEGNDVIFNIASCSFQGGRFFLLECMFNIINPGPSSCHCIIFFSNNYVTS